MNSFDDYPWVSHQDARCDASALPKCFRIIDSDSSQEDFQRAVFYLDSTSADLGVPTSLAPPVVARLIKSLLTLGGERRAFVLGEIEELTCGRHVESYSTAQRTWLREARRELLLSFHVWVDLAETGPTEEATLCIVLLSYVAECFDDLRPRVGQFFRWCREAKPELAAEIDAVSACCVKE